MEPPIPFVRWHALGVAEIAALFRDAPFRWGVAGGYALELFAGRPLRPHGDVDVAAFRDDQKVLRRWLTGWQIYIADPPGTLRLWPPEEHLGPEQNCLWCHRNGADAWELELLLENSAGDEWLWRRDGRVRMPRDRLFAVYDSVPCVRAEIQLLYKARAPRPKDEADFAVCAPLLDATARRWLADQITLIYGADHGWAQQLGAPPS